MASSFTTNKNYEQPATGEKVDTWGLILNANLALIDKNLGTTEVVTLTSADVTLTSDQIENMRFFLTGTLTQNVNLIFPTNGGIYVVENGCSGAFTVTLKTASAAGVYLPGGRSAVIISDGVGNIKYAQTPIVWPGTIFPLATTFIQPGYLYCDGGAYSISTYPALYIAIGTAYGTAGAGTFRVPDLRGRVPAGRDDMGGSAAGRLTSTTMTPNGTTLNASGGEQTHTLITAELPAITPSGTIAITDPGHSHTFTYNGNAQFNGGSGATSQISQTGYSSTVTTSTSSTGITAAFTGTQFGSNGAHNNVQPTLITNYIIAT